MKYQHVIYERPAYGWQTNSVKKELMQAEPTSVHSKRKCHLSFDQLLDVFDGAHPSFACGIIHILFGTSSDGLTQHLFTLAEHPCAAWLAAHGQAGKVGARGA